MPLEVTVVEGACLIEEILIADMITDFLAIGTIIIIARGMIMDSVAEDIEEMVMPSEGATATIITEGVTHFTKTNNKQNNKIKKKHKFLERATAERVDASNEGIFSRKLPVGESEKIYAISLCTRLLPE